jgi:2-(1,2-epoxy-1,2-dihydrophenyl)acetyl-CoA isomerase
MDYETLLFDVRDGVAHITLNRPDAANSLNMAMARDFHAASIRCDVDPEIRVVLMTGTGSMFCAGGDLKSFVSQEAELPAHLKEVTTYLHAGISRFSWMDPPFIAAVNGTAAGAGMSLVCATDLAIAARSAVFTMAYTRAGLVPDGSSTYYLSRHVGLHRAMELALTNRVLTADEACDWGIVNQVVDDDELEEAAGSLAAKLAAGPTASFGATKRLILEGTTEGLENQMERETRCIAAAAGSEDGREGVQAFLDKRKPEFSGR